MNDFNIQAASLISGVTIHQIRAWERRYNAINPRRLLNKFRSFTQEDISRLKLLGKMTNQGIAISKVASLDTEELQNQYDMLVKNKKAIVEEAPQINSQEELQFLRMLLRTRKLDIFKHEITKLASFSSVAEIIVPVMKDIMNENILLTAEESHGILDSLITQIDRISSATTHSKSI